MSYNPNSQQGIGRSIQRGYLNGTGSTLAQATLVSANTSGNLVALDVSNEALVLSMVGLTSFAIPAAANGTVISEGVLENVTTAFAIGDAIYASATPGALTNVKPDTGSNGFVAGDFVVFVGVLVQNEFNPAQNDIKLMLSVVGRL